MEFALGPAMADDAAMQTERMALVAGWDDTRRALAAWQRRPLRVVGAWAGVSLVIGVALLVATWAVARYLAPTPEWIVWSFDGPRSLGAALHIFGRNALVLVMHGFICVAGYMATTSLPIVAEGYTGLHRRLHLIARPVTIAFVLVVTVGSFGIQAWTLGGAAPGIALAYGVPVWKLLALVSPHALLELTAVFLPLGAWLVLARRGGFDQLLAASIYATALALPVLAIASVVEEYVTPALIQSVAS
ncbi:MAG: hypothetical protein JWN72_1666 [Thermoleophilia bacterium]|nr:hypothetical protein [Thermoleophilia bacterium]